MPSLVLTNFDLLDPETSSVAANQEILIEDKLFRQVGPKGSIAAAGAQVIDLGGRVVMPGLIDCHIHLRRPTNPRAPTMLPSLATAHAGSWLRNMLMRGFTTVRDAGGADAGHRQAVELDLFTGPRMLVSGRPLSQTGGHGDRRTMGDLILPCDCNDNDVSGSRIVDGVPDVRRAVREEIRLGADQIKVMAGGGVGSEADPLDGLQYSMEELEAVVDEATRQGRYVLAHVYTDAGIRRCIDAGVRTIEHGHFLSEESAKLMAARGMYLSPNFIVYKLYIEQGKALNYPEHGIAKAKGIYEVGGQVLDIARRAGVKVCFSTDLTKSPELQSQEFLVRAEMEPVAETLRSATVIGAEVVRMKGKVGVIAPGAFADLIAIDGNPLDDVKLLAGQGEHLSFIMKGGKAYKDRVTH